MSNYIQNSNDVNIYIENVNFRIFDEYLDTLRYTEDKLLGKSS